MGKIVLLAKEREIVGKKVKQLRKEGWIPGIVYKKGEESIPLQLNKKDLYKVLHTSLGSNVIISLKIEKESSSKKKTKTQDTKTVIVKEIQRDPLTDEILHIDFQQISLTEKIVVNVPISLVGEAIGVKRDGGILEHILWELQIECLPTDIPEKIEVDISKLEIGQSILVKDLNLPKELKVVNNPEQIIVNIGAPKEEKVEEKVEEITEPEVIRERKPTEEVEEKKEESK